MSKKLALALCAALVWPAAASAQTLRLGMQSEATSTDPHFYNFGPNNGISRHMFDALVHFDADDRMIPALAESWTALDEKTWELKLRKGVKFHDGSPFTADDVVFTFSRAGDVPKSPNSFRTYIGPRKVEKVDDHTVLFRSPTADPLLINNLPQIAIVSKKFGENATTEDYNSGKAAVGTGPFKFAEFIPGDRLTLVRNDAYWGPKPVWERAVFRAIKSDPARMAALIAGDVDVVENIPPADMARMRSTPQINVSSALSTRMMYLHLDRHRAVSPHFTTKDGKEMPNPLQDLRVRKALSLAINRQAIVERLFSGEGEPAAQFMVARYPDSSPNLKPEVQDLARARALLAEAGLPNGFRMTMHGPNGRYPNDVNVLEAMAQMFARIGVETKVETMAPGPYFTRASSGGPGGVPEFSVIFAGGGTNSAEGSTALIPLLLTFDRARSTGSANRGRYSNPKADELVLASIAVMDDKKRSAMLIEATDLIFNDLGMIPLYFVNNTWASRKPIKVEARTDEYTLVMGITRE